MQKARGVEGNSSESAPTGERVKKTLREEAPRNPKAAMPAPDKARPSGPPKIPLDKEEQYKQACGYLGTASAQEDVSEAINTLGLLAGSGHIKSQLALGTLLQLSGQDAVHSHAAQDVENAELWLVKAADSGEIGAQWQLMRFYLNWPKKNANNEVGDKAVQWLSQLYGRSHSHFHKSITALEKSGALVEGWLTCLAERGHIGAAERLAGLSLGEEHNEWGVAKTLEERGKWAKIAFDARLAWATKEIAANEDGSANLEAGEYGLAWAYAILGCRYFKGVGVAQSDEEALAWYRKAAQFGSAGEFLWDEFLITDVETWIDGSAPVFSRENVDVVMGLLEIAIQVGEAWEAPKLLTRVWLESDNPGQHTDRAIGLLESAAKRGSSEAMFELGKIYTYGHCVDDVPELAVRWLKKAEKLGNYEAGSLLAEAYGIL